MTQIQKLDLSYQTLTVPQSRTGVADIVHNPLKRMPKSAHARLEIGRI